MAIEDEKGNTPKTQRRGVWGEPPDLAFRITPRSPLLEPYIRPGPGRPVPLPEFQPKPVPVPTPQPMPQPMPAPMPPGIGPRPTLPAPLDPQLDPKAQPKRQPRKTPDPGPGDNTRVDEKCPWTFICFLPKAKHNRKEFRDQLKMQQGVLNTMSPDQYLTRRAQFGPAVKAAGEAARNQYRNRLMAPYIRQYGQVLGRFNFQSDYFGQAALHRLDTVAGGNPYDVARMGGGAENSTIGSQWNGFENPDDKAGSQIRVKKLDEHAAKLKASNCPTVNAVLEVCEMRYEMRMET